MDFLSVMSCSGPGDIDTGSRGDGIRQVIAHPMTDLMKQTVRYRRAVHEVQEYAEI
jgi:hypothetical protein